MDAIATEVLEEVSILARPEGRALPETVAHVRWSTCFNPRPARRPGAPVGLASLVIKSSPGPKAGRSEATRFNPRPARRPGAPFTLGHSAREFQSSPGPKAGAPCRPVSILARPEGRALLYVPHQNGARALHSRRFPAIRGAVCTRRSRSVAHSTVSQPRSCAGDPAFGVCRRFAHAPLSEDERPTLVELWGHPEHLQVTAERLTEAVDADAVHRLVHLHA